MRILFSSLACLSVLASAAAASAHAVVGERVFPATLAVDDPGVNDEFNLQATRFDDGGTWTTDFSASVSKRITQNLGLSLSGDWLDAGGATGMDNYGFGAKYVFYANAPHELMLSAGLNWDIGNTGATRIADKFDTFTPAFFFGKGFGDLPDSLEILRPFAVTGSLGLAIPDERFSTGDNGRNFNPNVLEWGFTLQYSIPYLQQHVKDIGLGAPLNSAVPVMEFSMATPTGGDSRATTGTINPGILFMGDKIQFGFEAVIPVNHTSGDRVGAIAQLHFYLDNIYPQAMRPLR